MQRDGQGCCKLAKLAFMSQPSVLPLFFFLLVTIRLVGESLGLHSFGDSKGRRKVADSSS